VGGQAPPEKSGRPRPMRPPGSATYDHSECKHFQLLRKNFVSKLAYLKYY